VAGSVEANVALLAVFPGAIDGGDDTGVGAFSLFGKPFSLLWVSS